MKITALFVIVNRLRPDLRTQRDRINVVVALTQGILRIGIGYEGVRTALGPSSRIHWTLRRASYVAALAALDIASREDEEALLDAIKTCPARSAATV